MNLTQNGAVCLHIDLHIVEGKDAILYIQLKGEPCFSNAK
jgi:hypothetical protein